MELLRTQLLRMQLLQMQLLQMIEKETRRMIGSASNDF
jgi:hypothetical protein